MPTLFKRSNGFYYISYEEDGKRRWKSTGKTLKGEAYSEMMQFQNHLKTYRSRMTLQQFTEELLSSPPKLTTQKPPERCTGDL